MRAELAFAPIKIDAEAPQPQHVEPDHSFDSRNTRSQILQIILYHYQFVDSYRSELEIGDKLRAAGATAEVIQAKLNEFNQLKENYKNPLYNSALTFLEPFPVGLLIKLTSAGILRKKRKVQIAATS